MKPSRREFTPDVWLMKESGVGGKKTTTGLRFERCAYNEGYKAELKKKRPKAMKAKSKLRNPLVADSRGH